MAIDWLDLDLRHLATFRTLADLRSFRATALKLGFAQSAISKHIATLEHRVGAQLVVRGRGPGTAELTPAGEVFLAHAEAIIARVGLGERDFVQRGRSTLRLGVVPSVSATLLPPALALAQQDGEISIELVDGDDPLQTLRGGRIDLAFSETTPPADEFAFRTLLKDPYRLVLPRAPTRDDTVVSAEELVRERLLTYRTSPHLLAIERELWRVGLGLRPLMRDDDTATLLGLVAADLGVALLPELAIPREEARFRSLPVDPRIRPRTICVAWNRERQPLGVMARLIRALEHIALDRIAAARTPTLPESMLSPCVKTRTRESAS
jgi:DNA-binding transcriptional LysR family regulator